MNPQYYNIQDTLKDLMYYMKKDLETCLNCIFVLAGSEKKLQDILEMLNISKKEIIRYMALVLQEEIKRQKMLQEANPVKYQEKMDVNKKSTYRGEQFKPEMMNIRREGTSRPHTSHSFAPTSQRGGRGRGSY